jgi:hypothetical protein
MNKKPSKAMMEAMLEDVTNQRNELQALLCATVRKAGGEIDLSNAVVQSVMGGKVNLLVEPTAGGVKLLTEVYTGHQAEAVQ